MQDAAGVPGKVVDDMIAELRATYNDDPLAGYLEEV